MIIYIDIMMEQNTDNDLFEMEKYVSLLNIFQIYYRNMYKIESAESLLDGVEIESMSSTNRAMELLYQYILEYKQNKIKDNELTNLFQNIDINNYDEVYTLIIDGKSVLYSPSFLSLMSYLVGNVDWKMVDWKITKIKGEL